MNPKIAVGIEQDSCGEGEGNKMGKYSSRSDLSLFQCVKKVKCRCACNGTLLSPPLAPDRLPSQSTNAFGKKLYI